jgi:hypothetical protein
MQGKDSVEVGDEREDVFAHSLIESPAWVPQRLINDGDKMFRLRISSSPVPSHHSKVSCMPQPRSSSIRSIRLGATRTTT